MILQEQIQKHLIHLKDLTEEELWADKEFFMSGIEKYSLTVIDDVDNNENKNEPDYGTMLPISFAQQDILEAKDVVVHYLHVMGHKKCMEFWKKCPYDRNRFKSNELDFIEEMYNQRLFMIVAPEQHIRFFNCFVAYDQFRPFKNRDARDVLNSLLQIKPHEEVPLYLKHIHERLYAADPLSQITFNRYIGDFMDALARTSFSVVIQHYDALE